MAKPNEFTYYHPIQVRYADLDPQGHVNNTIYLTYLESARLGYYEQAGIWDKEVQLRTGMVVAHIDIDYLAPIYLGDDIRVGLKMERIGHKSLTFKFLIESTPDSKPLARGTSVMVAFDNQLEKSRLVPDEWRSKINQFEKQNG